MTPSVFRWLAATMCAVGAVACNGGLTGEVAGLDQQASLASLEQGAAVQRTYVGVTQQVQTGGHPVVGAFDLLGGADLDLELVAKDGAPLRAELWQVHVDHWATLAMTVDDSSGFALHALHASEDSSWVLRFAPGAPSDVVVHLACTGSTRGCTPRLQPGEACPAGWLCDEGLTCEVQGGVCVTQ